MSLSLMQAVEVFGMFTLSDSDRELVESLDTHFPGDAQKDVKAIVYEASISGRVKESLPLLRELHSECSLLDPDCIELEAQKLELARKKKEKAKELFAA